MVIDSRPRPLLSRDLCAQSSIEASAFADESRMSAASSTKPVTITLDIGGTNAKARCAH